MLEAYILRTLLFKMHVIDSGTSKCNHYVYTRHL